MGNIVKSDDPGVLLPHRSVKAAVHSPTKKELDTDGDVFVDISMIPVEALPGLV